MDAHDLLASLCRAIDAHAWDELPALLHDDFECRYVHTGETFDKDGWVRVNAEYPDFERMHVEDLVASGDRAVARCRVTATTDGEPVEFAVATFVTARDERIVDMTEVWTDVGLTAPEGTRPDPA